MGTESITHLPSSEYDQFRNTFARPIHNRILTVITPERDRSFATDAENQEAALRLPVVITVPERKPATWISSSNRRWFLKFSCSLNRTEPGLYAVM
jgi:hypothetical protein